ncbi:hypothetical protein FSP39_022702 [Pinctada imbricata]|uniref:PHD-type domain-containing protein n=1 Tax=Pinctada imbricata TaxID=66713 RepID=A0AA89BRW4_PINIB|nr:hypothetical protein FSP39_022702 [Pinctada imbricata]
MERLCEFCSNSTEVEDMCGKLHVEKIGDGKVIAAHHRCMQYSAGLVQYKFDHFGGFKISKVEEEVKRGRRLKCAICKNMKDKKRRHGSATAGCAVASCRKTFHFYCAKKDPVAITKRMIIKYRKENKEVVMYRYESLWYTCINVRVQYLKIS